MIALRSAQAAGRTHLLEGKNLQDALTVISDENLVVGVICDGCSSGKHSEVGAKLASQYLAHYAERWMKRLPALMVAEKLDSALRNYLLSLMNPYWSLSVKQRALFVQDFLLFTVIGFLWTPDESIVFYAGDGTMVVDDTITHINPGSTPAYSAYRLVPDFIPPNTVLSPLTLLTFGRVQRLMIGSDAWKDEAALLPNLLGVKHLQREINILSDQQHRFKDDVSIIVLEVGS